MTCSGTSATILSCLVPKVNYLGTVAVTQKALPLLREQPRASPTTTGRSETNAETKKTTLPSLILNVGSIGARQAAGFGSAYLCTKAAMVHFNECLRQEMAAIQPSCFSSEGAVRVVLLEPGFFDSNLLSSGAANGAEETATTMLGRSTSTSTSAKNEGESTSSAALESIYGSFSATMEGMKKQIRMAERANGSTKKIGRLAAEIVGSRSPPKARYVIGWDARLIQFFVAYLPCWVTDLEFRMRFRSGRPH